jgi:hypothetical protein
LRWWRIATLNHQWNTRVIVIPGAIRIDGGPYRFVPHPNYAAVVAEGFALPLVHTAWITACALSILNGWLLRTRIKVENAALANLTSLTFSSSAAARPGRAAIHGARAEVHWTTGAEAYVTPIADDCVGIALLTSRRGGFDCHLKEFLVLRDRMDGLPHETERAAGPMRQRVSRRTAGRVLLVGDAAGYVDALTGEGLGLAFGGAESLVKSVVAEHPDTCDRQWHHMTWRYRMLTAALLQPSAYAPARSRIVPAAVAMPTVFTGIVNLLAE